MLTFQVAAGLVDHLIPTGSYSDDWSDDWPFYDLKNIAVVLCPNVSEQIVFQDQQNKLLNVLSTQGWQ